MKWFKHYTNASDDELLEQIIEEFGLDGYARWWLLLEAIAKNMDETNKCSAEYSWVKWQQILRGKRNKLETFLKRFGNKLETNEKQNGNVLEIKCSKLLELRDNYTKNLQVPSKPTCKQEVEVEVEEEKDNNKGERKKAKKFTPPTIEEVRSYCLERSNGVDPEKWMNHYEAKGWMIGKNKMIDWKAAVRTWEEKKPSSHKPNEKVDAEYAEWVEGQSK